MPDDSGIVALARSTRRDEDAAVRDSRDLWTGFLTRLSAIVRVPGNDLPESEGVRGGGCEKKTE